MLSLKQKAKESAQRAAFLSTGALFCLAGLGFLTFAGWYFLITVVTPLEAALIIAGVYFGIGFLLVGLALRHDEPSSDPAPAETATQAPDAPPLVQAFLYGMQAGARAGSNRS